VVPKWEKWDKKNKELDKYDSIPIRTIIILIAIVLLFWVGFGFLTPPTNLNCTEINDTLQSSTYFALSENERKLYTQVCGSTNIIVK